ncbi:MULTISPECIES: hypothetical protein [Pandoraea]|uniref:hypothetical protein n=1 Tax=Pandoraea TaxID=93217 RepID=UPI001F5E32B5|nr:MULTISPECIES: hypothetical protein [Pandoraea]MCI3207288.1 hypothetical protein [Pandoraea sp. LA3]MDN4585317.1 hypothetical protein [Pandoraea capi]
MTTAIDALKTLSPAPADDEIRPLTLAQRVQEMRSSDSQTHGIEPLAQRPAPMHSPGTEGDDGDIGSGDDDALDPSTEWQKLFNRLMVLEWFDGWLDRIEETVDGGNSDS